MDDINFDDLIVGQIDSKRRWQDEVTKIETRIALNKAQPGDKTNLAAAKQKIKDADEAIADLNKQRNALKIAETTEKNEAAIASEKEVIDQLIKQNNIGYLVKENKYAYCMGMEKQGGDFINPVFDFVEATRFGRVLNKMAGRQLKLGERGLADELADHFQRTRNDYYMTTCSFNGNKWGRDKVYNKANIINKFWVEPDFENCENYDPRFDFLIRCVGGGKLENINHLEQWLAFKYLHPEAVANTPNLDIGGYPGGNGKGRYIELCRTIFTNPCVSAATLEELSRFNSAWEMAVVLYYDEPEQNELPEGKLKNATGSEDIRIEKKGIDATMADRNYSLVFLSNNPNGVVKLAGTGGAGEDRRYSVLTTNLVMVDEAEKLGMNYQSAKIFVNDINNLIKNRKEVAKWLAHIILKHNMQDVEVLHPLHGQDYHARGNDQKSALDVAFDLMLPVLRHNQILPYEILKGCVIAITGYDKLSDKKLKQDWKRYLEKNKLSVDFMDGATRVYVDYHFKNTNTTTLQKSAYVLQGATSKAFDLSSVLRKPPVNVKAVKDTCETRDMLVFDEN